jgi:hypothetical protein
MAVQIYITDDIFNKVQHKIMGNDAVFNSRANDEGYTLDAVDEKYALEFDRAEKIEGIGRIKTPFGVTDIKHLSTGLKTLLNIRYYVRMGLTPVVVELAECGVNILSSIFKEMNNQSVIGIMRNIELPEDCDFDFLFEGKYKCHGREELQNAFYGVFKNG